MQKYIFSSLLVALLLNLIFFPFAITTTEKVNPNCHDTTGYFKYNTQEYVDGVTCPTQEVIANRHMVAWTTERKNVEKDFAYFLAQLMITGVLFSGTTLMVYKATDKKKD